MGNFFTKKWMNLVFSKFDFVMAFNLLPESYVKFCF